MIRRPASRFVAPLFVAALSVLASQWAGAKAPAAPHGSVRVSKVFGWQAVPDGRMILWLGVSEPWMLSLEGPCATLSRPPRWVSTHDGHLVPGADAIGDGEHACRITRITQIPAAERSRLDLHAPTGGPLELRRHYSKHSP